MTQLFNTTDYDQDDEPGRHLRSVAAEPISQTSSRRPNSSPRSPIWRLDEQTIEIGRRGIELAREALRKSATNSTPAVRKAA